MKGVKFFALVMCLLIGLTGCVIHPGSRDGGSAHRGSYRGSYYQVKPGDSLYFIAYITNKNVNELIRFNNLKPPYTIFPKQKIKLWSPVYHSPKYGHSTQPAVYSRVSAAPPIAKHHSNTSRNKIKSKRNVNKIDHSKTRRYVKPQGKKHVRPSSSIASTSAKISKWLWPTKGRVVRGFSVGEQGNKGIDIAGQRGQPIVSTTTGTVVYSGNALRGYGNLIIVKHNNDYLSAYAHNQRLLVKEGQHVKAGQKIATMGSSGTKSVRLHFEIRYQGKSVNPKRYLP